MRFLGFIGPSYTLRSVNVDCQRCINMYPELNETGTGKEREVAALVPTPGLLALATVASGQCRGLYRASNGRVFAVAVDKLYEIDSEFNVTERGTLNSLTGVVGISDNGIQLIVVDGSDGYYLTLSDNSWAEITDPNFLGGNQVAYLDGYFIINKPNSNEFYYSNADSVTFDPTRIKPVEASPDNLVGLVVNRSDLWLFGEQTIEIYYNAGGDDVFQRIQGAFLEAGLEARWSIAKLDGTIFWLGKDDRGGGTVFMASGYQPVRVSTHAVEYAIRGYSNISDAIAYSYQDMGHSFYVLNFPSANTTWVYDTSTKLWHERVYLNQGVLERHRANFHVYAFGKHIVADYALGKLYELSNTVYSDDGTEILRRRIAPHISDGLARVFYSKFQLDIEGGVGLDGIQQGTDPKVMLRFSDDGGHTWSNEKWTSLGKIGQTRRRAIWRRLGQSRDRVFELSVSDPVKVIFIGAEMDVERGSN